MDCLLLEPGYKNKYPPIGLMKIAYFHRVLRKDNVFFAKGKLKENFAPRHWDRIYVTSLFTFEYAATIEAIKYAQSLADKDTYIEVGGIAATLMPDRFEKDTGIRPNCGLLNEPGKLGLEHDECIDELPLDYTILDQIDYIYPFHDAYFLSATKGCGMKCGFCAVQKLEPKFIPYYDIKGKVRLIDEQFGIKKDLLLMDNNVLISKNFNQIIDDILELGFERGATCVNPRTGKVVQRHVDFNQGLDAKLITPEKAKRLGEIALSPARIAFDHIEDEKDYVRAIELCTKYGVTEMSNYLLYNSEDFSGKGNLYHADTPENMYKRLRISLDLQTRLNEERPANAEKISIFSFPMRYIPLDATERGYIGSHWNAKFLRAFQCMMIPTQGKGVGSVSFFEADFGTSPEEFIENLTMPESLMRLRGHFVEKKNEDPKDREARLEEWLDRRLLLDEWHRLYSMLGEEKEEFVKFISDNRFAPEKLLQLIGKPVWQKLYYFYLTDARQFALLGMLNKESSTYQVMYDYIIKEFPKLYRDLKASVMEPKVQQINKIGIFTQFFGKEGLQDLLNVLNENDFDQDELLKIWEKGFQKADGLYLDCKLIRIYRRYVELGCLSEEDHSRARNAILNIDHDQLCLVLEKNIMKLQRKYTEIAQTEENGKAFLDEAQKKIISYLQLSIFALNGDL